MKLCGLRFVLLLALACPVAACGGGDEAGGGSVEKPLSLDEESVERVYDFVNLYGDTDRMVMKQTGTRTISGVEYSVIWAGNPDVGAKDGPEMWVNWDRETDRIEFAGGEIYWSGSGVVPEGEPFATGTLDEPAVIEMDIPVGEPQTVTVKGDFVFGAGAEPFGELTLTYTLEEEGVTADSPMGPIPNCRRYTGSTEVLGTAFEGELVMHDVLGNVSAWVNFPPPDGISLDMRELKDWGTASEGYNELQGMTMVGPESSHFRLDTYDANGAFDADKNTHAKMLLELRFADPAKAATDTEPAVLVEFGTAWGMFPHILASSPISIFHPEENGQGYTYWIAVVDQAAKNEPENGIAYHVSVTSPDYNTQNVRVSARIIYALYTP